MTIKSRVKKIENKLEKRRGLWSSYNITPILGGISRKWDIPPQAKLKEKEEAKKL